MPKWIKASERLPIKPMDYSTRNESGKKSHFIFTGTEISKITFRDQVYEWLDESDQPAPVFIGKDFVVRLRALLDKKMREHGIFDLMRNSSENYDDYNRKKSDFFDSFTDGDYDQLLKCFKAVSPSLPHP